MAKIGVFCSNMQELRETAKDLNSKGYQVQTRDPRVFSANDIEKFGAVLCLGKDCDKVAAAYKEAGIDVITDAKKLPKNEELKAADVDKLPSNEGPGTVDDLVPDREGKARAAAKRSK